MSTEALTKAELQQLVDRVTQLGVSLAPVAFFLRLPGALRVAARQPSQCKQGV